MMSDLRDPAIKLFGRTIAGSDPLPDSLPEESDKDFCEETNPDQPTNQNPDPSIDLVHGEPTNTPQGEDSVPDKLPSETETGTGTENQDKTLKKPDKIIPCPRCNSMDTKFCYYNNYNVNQPRHFCKKCQRYWTAGGTMRNVPVGAGRRKNKHLNRQLSSSSSDASEPVKPPSGSVVNFRPEPSSFSESMVSVLNIKEQRESKNGTGTGTSTGTGISNGTVGSSGCSDEKNGGNSVPPVPVPFFPGAPFLYPWNGGAIPVPIPVQPPPGTGFCPPAVPFPFVPASFWAFGWGPPQWAPSPSSSTSTCSTGTGLGKHKRDGTESPKNLWVPKTLRIDDPKEAAKSSIWDTLGIKHGETTSGLRAFRGKNENIGPVRSGTSQVLHANPAALSRSQSFQERT